MTNRQYKCLIEGSIINKDMSSPTAASAAEDVFLSLDLKTWGIKDGDIVKVEVLDVQTEKTYTFYVQATIQFTVVDEPPA